MFSMDKHQNLEKPRDSRTFWPCCCWLPVAPVAGLLILRSGLLLLTDPVVLLPALLCVLITRPLLLCPAVTLLCPRRAEFECQTVRLSSYLLHQCPVLSKLGPGCWTSQIPLYFFLQTSLWSLQVFCQQWHPPVLSKHDDLDGRRCLHLRTYYTSVQFSQSRGPVVLHRKSRCTSSYKPPRFLHMELFASLSSSDTQQCRSLKSKRGK